MIKPQHNLMEEKCEYPCLKVSYNNEGYLFDIGNGLITPGDMKRLSGLYLSHLHVDHVLGFDQLIRYGLGSKKVIPVVVPENGIEQLKNKIKGYTWNLADDDDLVFEVTELSGNSRKTARIAIPNALDPDIEESENDSNILIDNKNICIRYAVQDHHIPSLCYSFECKDQYNIDIEELKKLDVKQGAWLNTLKNQYRDNIETDIEIDGQTVAYAQLKKLIRVEQGMKIVYATDFSYEKHNLENLETIAMDCNVLYCEAAYLDEDKDKALENKHLTAIQAGQIATDFNAGKLVMFHHSRKYIGQENEFIEEAKTVFEGEVE